MRSSGTSRSAGDRGVGGLLAAFAAVSGAAVLVGIVVALIGMLLLLVVGQADAQAVALPLLPTSVAYDAAGNLYFADTNRHEVYESSLAGVLSVVAGNGVQGFSGDREAAPSAELDSPQGVAVGPDGTLYIADTGNERIRAVSGGVITTFAGNGSVGFAGDGGAALNASFRWPNALAIDASGALLVCDAGNERVRRISAGVIETIAGNGTQGFAGDGGAATAAELSLPRGLIVTSSGAAIFADSNNQRIRIVNASGAITTIAGNGVQGAVSDGSFATAAGMNTPRGVAVSSFGAPVYADALNHLVRESVANGNVYVPAGLAPARTSAVVLSESPSVTYGQSSTTVSVAGSAGTPQGVVELLDGSLVVTQTTLAGGTATFAPQALSTGTHALSAAFLGDGLNPAATSAVVNVSVAAEVITATANAASMEYGQPIPALTGSLSGVLPQDVGNLTAVFTTTAAMMSPPGSYPIVAALTGSASANYSVVMSAASGSLQIAQAASVTAEPPLAQSSYTGAAAAADRGREFNDARNADRDGTVYRQGNGGGDGDGGEWSCVWNVPVAGHGNALDRCELWRRRELSGELIAGSDDDGERDAGLHDGVFGQHHADGGRGRGGELCNGDWGAVWSVYRSCGFECEWIASGGDGVVLSATGGARYQLGECDDECADKYRATDYDGGAAISRRVVCVPALPVAADGEEQTRAAAVDCAVQRAGVAGGRGWMRCSQYFVGSPRRPVVYADGDGHVDEPCGRRGEPLDAGHARGGVGSRRVGSQGQTREGERAAFVMGLCIYWEEKASIEILMSTR